MSLNIPALKMPEKLLTSRSAILSFQNCPRKRFLNYHYGGHGITGAKLSQDLTIGSTVHRGLQHLLDHCLREHNGGSEPITQTCIDEAVSIAKTEFFEMLNNSSGFSKKIGEQTSDDFLIEETWNLCEALIRSYALWRIPSFFETFEVLEVEKEEESNVLGPNILFLAKADGLLRGRMDNRLYVLSYKTASDFPPVTMRNILHDMQGMSEIAAIEERLNRILDSYQTTINNCSYLTDEERLGVLTETFQCSKGLAKYLINIANSDEEKVNCHAVQYEFLLKGKRSQDPYGSGIYKRQNFLIHPYRKDGLKSFFGNSGGALVESPEYKWKAGKGRMAAEWTKINIWEDIGIENWIEILAKGIVQPEEGDPFQNIIISPEPILRDRNDIEEWKISAGDQEEAIRMKLDLMFRYLKMYEEHGDEFDLGQFNEGLQRFFPKYTHTCHDFYGSDCSFIPICHEGNSIEELIQIGVYKKRTPHHDAEMKSFEERGF